jgi:TetR/AcrR family transcriptional regulator, lmrAB and yxaGH operons repressor
MARTHSISDGDLIGRLSLVFRREGYSGASLQSLAEAAGLKKASLYHRFPRGKEQMAEEVLNAALGWYRTNILEPLAGPGSPQERVAEAARRLDAFYDSGRMSCLLNMLGSGRQDENPFGPAIKAAFAAIVAAFARVAEDGGASAEVARRRAERAMMLLHGSLVMSRGTESGAPFKAFVNGLQAELLGGQEQMK